MKPISSATTGLLAQARTPQNSTGQRHGATGYEATTAPLPAESNNNAVAIPLAEVRQWLPLLTESLTALNLVHTRNADGVNYTERKHTLTIPVTEAVAKLSTLEAMCLPAKPSEVSEVLKRLFTMPSSKADEDHVAEVWLMVLEGQPIGSIVYAFNKFIREPSRNFRPTSGQFLAVVEEHAQRVRNKARTLAEAIEGGRS